MSEAIITDGDLEPLPLRECGVALSWLMALFGGWAWLLSAGVWTWQVTPSSAGYILLAVLNIVLQYSSNQAAAAARRARAWKMKASHAWAVKLMVAGAVYNAFSVHHAWEATGLVSSLFPLSLDTILANAPLLALATVLAFFEPALYWIDETLRAEGASRKAIAEAAALKARQDADRAARALREAEEAARRERDNQPGTVTNLAEHRGKHVKTAIGAGVATAAGATNAAALPVTHDVTPPAYERPATEPQATTSDVTLDVAVRFADRMRDNGQRVSYRSLAVAISEATLIDATKVKARLERVFAANKIKIGERWPPPAKLIAA